VPLNVHPTTAMAHHIDCEPNLARHWQVKLTSDQLGEIADRLDAADVCGKARLEEEFVAGFYGNRSSGPTPRIS